MRCTAQLKTLIRRVNQGDFAQKVAIMSKENISEEPVKRASHGSIFSECGTESHKPLHWKRHLVIQIYPYVLFLIDALLVCLVFGLFVAMRYDVSLMDAVSRRVLLAIAVPSFFGLFVAGGYSYSTDKAKYRFLSEYIIMATAVFVVAFGLIYAVVAYGVPLRSSRIIVAGTLVIFPLCAMVYRIMLTKLQRYYEQGNVVCIIGAGDRAKDVYKRLKAEGTRHDYVVLSMDDHRIGKKFIPEAEDSPIVENFDVLETHSSIRKKYVEAYVVAADMNELPDEVSRKLVVSFFNNNRVYSYEHYLEHQFRIIPPGQLSVSWPLQEGFRLSRSMTYDRMKRAGDIVASLIGIVLAAPVLIGTAIAVKVTSPGPIIFKQARTGLREKPFMIYKFRSMTVGSEKGSKYTSPDDVRFTPIGKFIRKTRLDELPQLWNVLKGDLSLIGPRAEWVDLVERYEAIFPYYHFRHAVKPGITGWAQVNYSYGASNEDTLEKLYYDLYYVRRYSLALDVAIVIKTVYMMVFGRGQ
ncbi:hypothetical protein Rhal01_01371 [Rubritalea halochordaticola]|uniref:Bacterial sugar transferase domain-containing protein n=2 Tax=Rubritalea halochordaticola TaxID=714537 RepID=A0ABP9UXL2_9BACT